VFLLIESWGKFIGQHALGLKLIKHLLGVFAWSHIVLVGKGSGKIVNGIETKQK